MQTAKQECKKVLNDLLKIMEEKDVHNIIAILSSIKRDEESVKHVAQDNHNVHNCEQKPTTNDYDLKLKEQQQWFDERQKWFDETVKSMNDSMSYIEEFVSSFFYPVAKETTRTRLIKKMNLKLINGGKFGADHAADHQRSRSGGCLQK